MRTFTEQFRKNLREIRELSALITYESEEGITALTTENDENLLTELQEQLILEKGEVKLEIESINSINPLFKATLFKTICKSIEIDSLVKIDVGTRLNVKIGVLVNEEFEYMDFGYYYVKEEPTYQADTRSYLITAYDNMVNTMIEYDLNVSYPITVKNLLIAICNKLNIKYQLDNFVNQDKIIDKNVFENQDITYRDVLDDISEVVGGNLLFNNENKLIVKYVTYDNDYEVNEDDLKNVNVDITKKFGEINYLAITSNGIELANEQDGASIENNGKTLINFDDNYILLNDYTLITDIFNKIKGISYWIFDFDSIGLLVFEPLDSFTINLYDNIFPTIILNDDIKLTSGLVETIYNDEPEKSETEETIVVKDKLTKKINNAAINIDKANAQIVLKVDSDGKISSIELNGDADDGQKISIATDQLELNATDIINLIAGNTINLTSKNIVIDSTNFKVDKDGNMECNNAKVQGEITSESGKVGGWDIADNSLNNGTIFLRSNGFSNVYTMADIFIIEAYILGENWAVQAMQGSTGPRFKHYDLNNDGVIDIIDLLKMAKMIFGEEDK